MRIQDYKLNSQLRAVFVRKWVDLSCLDYGVTNGVVYLRGTLRHHLSQQHVDADDQARDETLTIVRQIEKTLRQMHGVRDVIFQLKNVKKKGATWVHL